MTYSTRETTIPFTGPTKKGAFRKGTAWTRLGKLAKVPPVIQATTAPTTKEMSPGAEKPDLKQKFSFFP